MFSEIWQRLKEMIQGMINPKSVEQVLHVVPAISNEMIDAIELWELMYEDKAPWLKESSPGNPAQVLSLGLPAFIASEKARMAVMEMKFDITPVTKIVEELQEQDVENNPDEKQGGKSTTPKNIQEGQESSDIPDEQEVKPLYGSEVPEEIPQGNTEKAEYLADEIKKLKKDLRKQLEYGVAKGGFVIKPYVIIPKNGGTENGEPAKPHIYFDYIQAGAFYPLAFDGSQRITEAAFIQRKVDKDIIYTRLEHHILKGSTVTVKNRAFKSMNTSINTNNLEAELGTEIPLTDVPEWASLEAETKIQNVDRLLFAYFKMPEANTIDPYSPLGVSGFSRATKLIEQADLQYSRLLWEYEGGELAIDVDRDALTELTDLNGVSHTVNPHLQERLFRPIDLGESNTYNVFNPTFRDTSLIAGLNTILMRIEDVCGLSRGTLTDAATEARTATELKILKQRNYATNADIQAALEDALRDVIYIMDVYCILYELVADGEYDVSFEWDDSILVDVDAELGKRITLMQNGLASKVETRMWYYGETERQALEALAKIRELNTFEMEENMRRQMMMGQAAGEERDEFNS